MGVPASEVGYTPDMPRREDNEVHRGHVGALEYIYSSSFKVLKNQMGHLNYPPFVSYVVFNYAVNF